LWSLQFALSLQAEKESMRINSLRYSVLIALLVFAGGCISYAQDVASSVKSDSVLKAFLHEQGVEATEGNKVRLLESGREKFNDMFSEIRKARHHVHLEYFNFRNDSIAGALFDLLAQKASEGVEVRALFDAFGNMSNNKPLRKKYLKVLRKKGIEIYEFDPIRFPWLNHVLMRDHRKIVVVDGKTGYTGGMNVADYYIHGTQKVGNWRDMHLRIEGPAVHSLQEIFLKTWNKVTKQKIGGQTYFPVMNTDSVPEDSAETVAIVDRCPNVTPDLLRHTLAESINSANEKVQIINPYFAPTHTIKEALKKALKRGVTVEIMIPAVSDIPFTPEAALYQLHKLQKRGARVFLFQGGFHHSKIMMIDGVYSTVGSANLNSRSLRYDYEVNAFIFNKSTTNDLVSMFEKDKQNSVEMTSQTWKNRSLWKRFVGWFANLFTPVL